MYNSLFKDIFNGLDSFTDQVDSVESSGDVYIARAILPGIKRKNLKLKANSDYLKIYRKDEKEDVLLRRYHLGGLVDLNSISSKLEDGILEITLPKNEVSKTVEVEVK